MTARKRLGTALTAAAALVLCGGLAACSSSSGSSNGNTSSDGASGSSSSSGGGDLVAAAKAAVAKYSAKPTKIPVTGPLAKKPTAGKTLVWMNCQLSGCAEIAGEIKTAVAAVGWNYQQISYDQANPASLVSAMQQALRYNPSYVVMSGVAQQAWASVLPAYKAAGVKIVASYLGHVELTDTIIANAAGEGLDNLMGEQLAQWFIAKSEGKGSVLLQTINDYPSNKIIGQVFQDTVAKNCPACHVDTMNVGLADAGAGQAVPQVVSQLRTKPNDTYLVGTYVPFLDGLPAALSSAGLGGKITIAGGYAATPEQALIKKGDFAAGTVTAGLVDSFAMVDAALRDETGTPQPASADASQLLITGGDFEVTGTYLEPKDAAQQFEKLWLVS